MGKIAVNIFSVEENMRKGTKGSSREPIPWRLFQKNIAKLTIIAFSFLLLCTIASPYSYPARKSKKHFKDFSGLHGRVTSITRFYPFELYDVSLWIKDNNTFSNGVKNIFVEFLEILQFFFANLFHGEVSPSKEKPTISEFDT